MTVVMFLASGGMGLALTIPRLGLAQGVNPVRPPAGANAASASPAQFESQRPMNARPIELSAGAAPSGSTGPGSQLRADEPATADAPIGPIGPGDAARLVSAQMPRLRPCYERALPTHRTLAGRVELRFTIASDGRVSQSRAYGLPEAPEVATCLADVIRATTFPRPANGTLPFIFPLTFAPPVAAPHARSRRAPASTTRPAAH